MVNYAMLIGRRAGLFVIHKNICPLLETREV